MAFDLGSIFASVGVDISNLDKGLMQAQVKLAAADKSISSFGQKLTANSTKMMMAGGLMVGAVAGVAIAAVDMASKFETSMRNVNSISKLSETEFKALGESVVGISKKFPQSAKELADGLYDIASSGFSGAAGLKVLEASAMAASAGITTTAVSAKGITAVLNAFGLGADQAGAVADTMFRTVDKGVITFEELSSTVGDWIGLAKIAGISFNEASGAIAYMTTKGIGASEAGTALQRLMISIIQPTDEMAAAIQDAGYESGEMMLKQVGLTGAMKFLSDATGGSASELIKLIPRIEGVKGANALLGSGYESLTKFMGGFVDTSGSAAIALEQQSKSLDFQLKLLKNNATALGIELGNKLIPSIAGVVKGLNDLSPAQKDAIYNTLEMTLKVVAAGGAVLLLAGAFGKLRMAVLANPIMAVVAGFIALNGAVDLGAGKLESMNNAWATTGAVLLRTLAPLTQLKKDYSDYITINSALLDGTIQLTDTKNLNIFTMQKELEKIRELRAEKEAEANATVHLANSTFNYTDALAASTTTMDGNKTTMESMGKATEDTGLSADELSTAIDNLVKGLANGSLSTGEFVEGLKKLGLTVNSVDGGIQGLVTSMYRLFNINQSLTEAEKAYEEAIKNKVETLKKYKLGTDEATTAINGAQDATETYVNSLLTDINTIGITTEKQEELRLKYLAVAADSVVAGEMTRQDFMDSASTAGVTSNQIILALKAAGVPILTDFIPYIESGKNALAMFGDSSKDPSNRIIKAIEDASNPISMNFIPAIVRATTVLAVMGAMEVKPEINLDVTDVMTKAKMAQEAINSIHGSTVDVTTNYYSNYVGGRVKSMGGIVGMASGGIVGMPQAASGMVVPQTGRAYPIIAHEYEDIVNTSQQRNLAEWIMGKANSRPDSKSSSSNEVILHNVINLDGKVLWESNEKYDIRAAGVRV